MYSLVWVCSGVVKETIMQNVSYPLAKWKQNKIKSGYTYGKLEIRTVN